MILRNLARRKTRSLLTIMGIAIGVATIVMMGAMADGLAEGYTATLGGSGADLILTQQGAFDITLSALPESAAADIQAMPEVREVAGLLSGIVTTEGSPYFFIFGHEPQTFTMARFRIVEGQDLVHWRGQGRPLILGKLAAQNFKLKVGDTIRLTGSAFRVAGIFETGSAYEEGAAVMTLADAQALLQKPRQVGAFQIKLKDPSQVERVKERLARQLPDAEAATSVESSGLSDQIAYIRGFAWGLSLLAIIIGGVGMTNTLMMTVFERTREIGTLRALGWGRRRILSLILGESIVLGELGGLAGCLLGALAVMGMATQPALTWLGGRISPPLVLQAMGVALVLGGVGGLYPAWWATRLQPIEALRYEGGAGGQMTKRLPLSPTLRSLWRRKTRTLLTLVGAGIGLAAVIALSGLAEGFVKQINALGNSTGSDIIVRQANASDISYSALDERIGRRIAALPGVQYVSGMLMGFAQTEKLPIFIMQAYNPAEYAIRHFKIIEGRPLAGTHQILLGHQAAEALSLSAGETMRLGETSFRVVGIFETGVAWEDQSGVIALRDGQALWGKPRQVATYGVKVSDPNQAETIQAQIEAAFPETAAALSANFAESLPEMQNANVIYGAIGFLAILVGGIGMMNTMIMSVFERTREIGTLRALGWRRRQVIGQVLRESLLLGLLGVAVGAVLAWGLGQVLSSVPGMGGWFDIDFGPRLITLALLLGLGLGAVGGLYPAWRASNLSPAEALRYE
jgi:ABC-type lipoprotein release transport system permease subunit